MKVTTAILLFGALALLAGCGRTSEPIGVSKFEETPGIAPSAIRFFTVDVGDKRFSEDLDGIYAVQPDDKHSKTLTDAELYQSVAAGRWRAPATANQPFLLLGKLPGGRHPSQFEYRVLEARHKDMTITCNLDFTYHILPGTGPGVPQIPYFMAEMPGLPAGEYTVVFHVVNSYTSDGTNKRTPDKTPRDALATEPYSVKFKIMEKQ